MLGAARALRCLLLVIAGLGFCGPVQAAAELTIPDGRGGTVKLYERAYALVIGINNYKEWPVLSGAISDAQAVADELKAQNFEVTLKMDLDLKGLTAAIDSFIDAHGGDENARVLIWFAGHGHTVKGEGFIVPTDGLNTADEWRFTRSALSLRRFGEYMRNFRSKHVLAVFDSCFGGTVFQVARANMNLTNYELISRPVRQYISSGDADQVVSDDGLFRKLFISAIRGDEEQADFNRDGFVTGEELGFFLSKKLPALRAKQTPRYGKIAEFELDRGDFVFHARNAVKRQQEEENRVKGERAWEYVKDSQDKAVVQAFRDEFGKADPFLDSLAANRLNDIARDEAEAAQKALANPSVQQGRRLVKWSWDPAEADDGNWGLKALGLPSVWPLLADYRGRHPDALRVRNAVIGSGAFSHVDFKATQFQPAGIKRPGPPYCQSGEATHLLGVIAAQHANSAGIEGVYPGGMIDSVEVDQPVADDSGGAGGGESWELRAALFDDVLAKSLDYTYSLLIEGKGKYQGPIVTVGSTLVFPKETTADLENLEGLALHLQHQANLIGLMASRVEEQILYVVPAGDGSEHRKVPLKAEWATPFAWAALTAREDGTQSTNILVVEAVGRDGWRAPFSNTGGHVAAPGVDIMSTSAAAESAFGLCSGTATAAAFASGVAAIVWEINPGLKPADVIRILKESARAPRSTDGAPRIDAIAAAELAEASRK